MDRTQRNRMGGHEFRRNSSCDHGKEVVDRKHMLTILDRMGQSTNEIELNKFIDTIDIGHTGMLDYNAFIKVFDRFVKDAAALAKFKGDEFAFKNVINLSDFQNP